MRLIIAWRNLWRHPRRTAAILLAVVVGVWAMVFFSAFMRGMSDDMIRQQISNMTGHVQVQAPGFFDNPTIEKRIEDPGTVAAALAGVLPADARVVSRVTAGGVLRSSRGSFGASLIGIDLATERGVSFIGSAVLDEHAPGTAGDGLVVGAAMVDRLQARIGHRVVVDAQDAGGRIVSRAFVITGVFRAQLEASEKRFVFCRKAELQDMLGLGDDVTEFCVVLPRAAQADAVAAALREALPDGGETLRVLTWREMIGFVAAYADSMGIFAAIWNAMVFVAMAFGLVNTILMAVFERVREFGLVRALGVTPGAVLASVLVETAMLLAVGLVVGMAVSFATVSILGRTGIDFSGLEAGADYFGISRVVYPIAPLQDYLSAGATVVVLGLLVSLYPAIKAARITPVQAMTHV